MKDERLTRIGPESLPPHLKAQAYSRRIDEIQTREAISPIDQRFKQLDLRVQFEEGLILLIKNIGGTFTEKLFAEYKPPQDTPDNVHQLFPSPPSPTEEMLQTLEPDFQELAHRLLPLSPAFYKLSIFRP